MSTERDSYTKREKGVKKEVEEGKKEEIIYDINMFRHLLSSNMTVRIDLLLIWLNIIFS